MRSTATDTSLTRMSRASGELYALIFLLAPIGFLVGKQTVYEPGDAAATTANLLENETLFRLGMLAEVGVVVIELVLAGLLYALFRRASRSLALGAALTRAAEATIQAVNLVPSMVALAAASGAGVYADLAPASREAVVLGAMDAYQDLVYVWGVPFALHVAFLGLLVARSRLMPRWIGWLLLAAAAGYLADSLTPMVWPAAGSVTETAVMVFAIPAELAFAVWLIVAGVRRDRWRELAAADAPGLRAALPAAPREEASTQVAARDSVG